MASLVAAISGARKYSSVISNCQRRANFHRALCGGSFLGSFRLFKKMNSSFVAVVSDEIRRFLETESTQCAACVYIPLSGRVLGLFAQFVGHDSSNLRVRAKNITCEDESNSTIFQMFKRERFQRASGPCRMALVRWGFLDASDASAIAKSI